MNKIIFTFLIIVLAINTLRYGTYLLEGDAHLYYFIMFFTNLIATLSILFFTFKEKQPEEDEQWEDPR